MAAPLRVTLTTEEELTLQELRRASSVPYRVRDRAHIVLLNASGWNAPVIAEIMSCHEHTARAAIKRWEEEGLYGLWEEEGRGKKRTWEPSDMDFIEQCLNEEERTYNSTQLAAKLEAERGVTLSPDWIRQLLKKRAIAGSAPARVIDSGQDAEARVLAEAHLIELEALAATGQIVLKYLDETGCCQWTPESYSYSRVGQQKRFEQTSRRGRRVSILGVWDPDESFDYALVLGGFNGERYIEVMDWLATKAAKTFEETGQLTFLVQDNCTIHKSQAVQAAWPRWQAQGLFMLFLPPYCSELNPIEGQWHQLKTHEIAGRMFEYEDDLAEAIVDGMIDRSIRGEYELDRLILNYS